ncbi:MAG: Hsp20/alpha crystallin family protein [Aeriscardovia sp.]|nr:Hsp20/alpha crystallin family protein [Aeriscardovia sp.]MBQ5493493.1 Hsp20/alpha crystallin family protein [Aeriscardovia sp.]MBQ5521111.1 Hsp20/alpha crystallin family protein [Aeriscardovia sp.]MBQ5556671.1 Hsp20/alpha crystallin family protein [Aeriscardovia sp.]MBQ5762838.1 Hsp20/alpha crystallin family protein [Aeriscardovia sp.]
MAFLPDVINDLADTPWGAILGRAQSAPMSSLMRTDVSETPDDYRLEIELPGFTKKEIHLQLKDGYLIVSAKKGEKEEEGKGGRQYLRRERSVEACSRTFYVGKDLLSSDIKARLADGILTLTIPKEIETPKGEEFIEIAD